MDRCFVVAPIGFESELEKEIREVWPRLLDASARPHGGPLPNLRRLKGGVEIEAEAFLCVQLNFFLKTASRILWRLAEFKCRDFPKLHERLQKIDLRRWLGPEGAQIEVAAQRSRLNHEGRIRETALSAWGWSEPGGTDAAVYIRLDEDNVTVSLDTTGEHLHKRGYGRFKGDAPLRETVAAFCLRQLIGDIPEARLQEIELVDPMAGSGTLLMEAALLRAGNYRRPYAFQKFHGFPKLFRTELFAKNYRHIVRSSFASYIARDLSPKAIEACRENWQQALAPSPVEDMPVLSLAQEDLCAAAPLDSSRPRWVIVNPPYGDRLQGPPPEKILNAILEVYQPERLGLLLPREQVLNLPWPPRWKTRQIPVRNGGLDCLFVIGQRP